MPAPSIVLVTSVPPWVSLSDPDVRRYIQHVEAADGQALEPMVRRAIDAFVRGCKADGIWNAIKASCILAGARTLSGALVPLVGTAPTNFNFVSGDYNRTMGLVGNGSTKYLNSNRNNNADPQNSKHISVFVTTATPGGNWMNSGPGGIAGRTGIGFSLAAPNQLTAQTSANNLNSFDSAGNIAGANVSNRLAGLSRSSSTTFTARFNGANTVVTAASDTPNSGNITVFARPASPVDFYTTSRLAFYSIGESLNLALLDARVTTLLTAISNSIEDVILLGMNNLRPVSAAEFSAVRSDLINRIWSGSGFPTTGATSTQTAITDPLAALGSSPTNLLRCDGMTIQMRDNSNNLLTTSQYFVWHPTLQSSNGKGIITVGGHSSIPELYAIRGGRDLIIKELVEAGYTVLGTHMPFANADPSQMVANHNALPAPTPTLNYLRTFVEGQIRAANQLSGITSWGITGLSGGGWTALLVAALDPRFTGHSHAGFWPLFISDLSRDWEQFLPGIYPNYDYTDLTLMATSGGRKFLQSYATEDSCCFTQAQYNTKPYAPLMASIVQESGGRYELLTVVDNQHRWQPDARAAALALFNAEL